jgi:predicted transcriptional regulator
MKGPQNVDDIIRELEESDFEKDKKGKFSINKKGKTSIQLDF